MLIAALTVLTACTRTEPGPTSESASPSRAAIAVNTDGLRTEISPGGMAKWADDVSRGDVEAVVAKCWTVAPEYIRSRYFADTGALTAILAQRPVSGQAGVSWGEFGGAYVYVPWHEGRSDYPCPRITRGADQHLYPDDYIAHRARRFILRAQGKPINPADTETAYPIECAFSPGVIADVDRGDPERVRVFREEGPHGVAEWTVRAGDLTLKMVTEPGDACVRAAAIGG